MALRTLTINKRLKDLEDRELELRNELNSLEQTEQEYVKRFNENKDDDSEINDLFEKSEQLENSKNSLNGELEEILAERDKLKEEIKFINEGEKVDTKIKNTEKVDKREALNAYFEGKDRDLEIVRAAGLVSSDAEVLIPVDIVYQPKDEIYTEQDLEQYINVVSVATRTGKYPILKRTSEKMHTVAELDENPRLANPKFDEVLWDVDTYRAYLPVSQEAKDDSAIDITALIARHILRVVLNTTNSLVAPILKAYQPAIAKNLDDLKKLDDVMLDPAYQRAFYMSRSMYHYLNTLKDSDGNYVLQPDVTSPSGKSLFGWPIIRINDNLIGDYNGQLVCFFGDTKAAVTKFNRTSISAVWDDHDIYGTKIQSGFRADYKACDPKAGYYVVFAPVEKDLVITTSDEQEPETVEGVSATIAVENNVATIKYTGLTGQVILCSLQDSKGALVAEMKGRYTSEKTEDTITVTFYQDMVKGDYTLTAKVLDQKKYKAIKSVKINIKQKSDEIAKTLNGTPIVIAND